MPFPRSGDASFSSCRTDLTDVESSWMLTVFQNGDRYLAFKRAVALVHRLPELPGNNVIDREMYKIVRGFNRALTGLMTSEDGTLWLASPVGKSDDPSGSMTTSLMSIPLGRGSNLFYIRPTYDLNRNIPCLRN